MVAPDGFFTRLSSGWERCLGWSVAELMVRSSLELIHPDDLEHTLAQGAVLAERGAELVE